jgi:hypothetical protein
MTGWQEYGSNNSKPQEMAVLEYVPVNPAPPPKYIRLGSVRQIRYELAAVYRLARTNKMASGEATRLTYILNILSQMTVDSQFEERLSELEENRK